MLSINITTQPIKMEFNTQRASLHQTTTMAQLSIETEAAKLDIQQPHGQLEIDQTACRYARGVKNMTDLTRDYAQAGMNSAVAGVGRIAEEGNRLARIESGENAIANIAADNSVEEPVEITWAYVPMPDIRYTPNPPQIHVTDATVNNSSQLGSVRGDYRPAQVNINVAQYPSVTMWVSDNKVNMAV